MSSKLLVPVRSWEARRALRHARRAADDELIATRLPSPRLAWRAVELVAEPHRLEVARSLTDVVHSSDERLLPTAAPLARSAIRECRPQLLALAARLYDVSLPVTARGVLLVERLLCDAGSPLFGSGDPDRLLDGLARAQASLEARE